jgi:hypothetical protein
VLFHASYKLIERVGFHNCRSSSTVFTREAFETVGGYDDVLTEDLDFSDKCYREGIPVVVSRYRTNSMEAPIRSGTSGGDGNGGGRAKSKFFTGH